jgi:transcriptional regulator with XRE-family HTH domain
MEQAIKKYKHLSKIISHTRLQQGSTTLKEFYRAKKPKIDYQTWLHIESGRRIPSTDTLIEIGDLLNIDRDELIIAYCKDRFHDEKSLQVIKSFKIKNFFDIETIFESKDHDRSADYVFNSEQMQAMAHDPRLRLYLMYTYDCKQKTSIARLANFFKESKEEVYGVIKKLESLGLVESIGEEIKKIYPHTTIPITNDAAKIRKELLLKSLELNIDKNSHITNFHVRISNKSYKKILALFDLVEANLIKMEKEDSNKSDTFLLQIAIAGNSVIEEKLDEKS